MFEPLEPVAEITITPEDILYILGGRIKEIKNRKDFMKFLRKSLPQALDAHLCDEVKFLTDLYLEREKCPHRRQETFTTGGYYTVAGEAYDNIQEITICLDCGKQLDEKPDADPDPDADAGEAVEDMPLF